MHADAPLATLDPLPAHRAGGLRGMAGALLALGLIGLVWGGIGYGPSTAFAGVLAATMAAAALATGALFFTAAHILGGAHWTIPLRRLMDGLAAGWAVALAGFIVLAAAGGQYLYEWVYLTGDQHHALFHAEDGTKAAWMTPLRWTITGVAICLLFIGLRWLLSAQSRKRDGGAEVSAAESRIAVFTLLLGMPAFTLFAWDNLLALEVTFPNAIWGVYCMVGGVQLFLGVLTLVVLGLGAAGGPLHGLIRRHIRHDLGTWMLVWGCVVAYIAFAQYLIIYFANIDEEVAPFLKRMQHGYGALYVAEAVLRTAIPFALLMSQRLRTHPIAMGVAAIAMVAGNLIDLAWWIAPTFSPNQFAGVGPILLGGALGLGACLLLADAFWRRHGVLAKDPRLLGAVNGDHLH